MTENESDDLSLYSGSFFEEKEDSSEFSDAYIMVEDIQSLDLKPK